MAWWACKGSMCVHLGASVCHMEMRPGRCIPCNGMCEFEPLQVWMAFQSTHTCAHTHTHTISVFSSMESSMSWGSTIARQFAETLSHPRRGGHDVCRNAWVPLRRLPRCVPGVTRLGGGCTRGREGAGAWALLSGCACAGEEIGRAHV